MRRTGRNGSVGRRSPAAPEERRRYPRETVSWRVRVWLEDDVFAAGRTTDVSMHGLCVIASNRVAAYLRVGQPCRLEVEVGREVVRCVGEIRRITERGIGFEIRQSLPLDLVPNGRPQNEPDTAAVP